MKQIDKIVFFSFVAVFVLASFLGFEVVQLKKEKEAIESQYNIDHSQVLADSVITLNKQIEDLNRNAIKEYIKTENLKTNRNETINSIDTMSTSDLYQFFTKQF